MGNSGLGRNKLANDPSRGTHENEQAKKPSKESERWLLSVVQNTSHVVTVVDADGTVRYVSPSIEQMLGYRPQERMGRSCFELLHPEDLAQARSTFAEALRRPGDTLALGVRMRHRDESWRHVEVTGTNLLDDPSIRGIVINWRDVTDHKLAEEALKASEERFRLLAENATDVIYLYRLKPTPGFAYVSPSVTAMTGYTPEEHYADPELSFKIMHPDDRHLFALLRRSPELTERAFTLRWRRKDGKVIWTEQSNKLMYDEVGDLVAVEGIARDVTERKEAEEALKESEERFRLLVERVEDYAIFMLDAEGHITTWNEGARRINGYEMPEIVGDHFSVFYPEEDVRQGKPSEELRVAVEKGHYEEEGLRVRKDGSRYWASVLITALQDEEGDLRGFSKVVCDVTERKRAEEVLRRSEASLAEAQRIAHLGNWEWNVRTGEVWWSDETYRICGFEPGQFVPTLETVAEVFHPDDRHQLRALIDDAFHEEEPDTIEHRIVRPDGEVRWVHRQYEVGYGERGEPIRLFGTVHDITERKALEERLEHQAFHDPLTNLPNRRLFMDRLEQALMRTRRRRGRKVGVLFMDLDNFNVVNDALGHEAGDRLLVAVSEGLRRCLRPEDTLAHFGGDEFTVLIEDVKQPVDAAKVAERILEVLNVPFILDDRELFVNASIGIAFGGEGYTKLSSELLRHADAAMYRAKEDRLVGYEIFEPSMYEQVLGRLELENSLRRALENEELRVYYQPQFRLLGQQNNRIARIEALVRWEHPQRGLILPDEFIPIAEETGLIFPLGRWILMQACRQAKEWQGRYPSEPPLAVCVNISAEQVRHPGLAREVSLALQESELEPGSLVLEITEGTLLKDTQASDVVLGELKALGVRLAIDDFGKEYSSLSYLKRLPVDGLKLDRSFVEDLEEDQKNTTIVEMVISLAHSLGLEVTGEGVESAKQLEYLRERGCDLVQGEYLAKALPSEEVNSMLAASLRLLP